MAATKIQDFTFNLECFNLCERYGLDSTSTASLIAFAIDLFQKGIIGENDTEGLHLSWGNPKVAFSLIEKIAHREGFGDLLANGVHAVAKKIDQGAEEHAFHLKGLEILPFQLYTPHSAYASAVSDRADMMKTLGQSLTQRLSNSQEKKEQYIRSGFFPYPKELEKYLWAPLEWAGEDYDRYVKCISYESEMITLSDCVGNCIYWTGHYPFPPYQHGDIARLVSFATGLHLNENDLMMTARRVNNLIKSYHLLSGLTINDDTVPSKFFNEPPPAPKVLMSENKIEKFKLDYYKLRGWDENGVPKKITLSNLGLDYAIQTLKRKGIECQ